MGIMLLLRFPILSSLLMELYDFSVIALTVNKMLSPFLSVLFSLYLVIFMFGSIGVVWFSGVVRLTKIQTIEEAAVNGLYYLLNFNDLYAGMLTLYAGLVSINGAITDMYCALIGNNWPRLYFATFFVLTFLIVLNIVIAFIIEVYAVSHELTEKQINKIKNANKI